MKSYTSKKPKPIAFELDEVEFVAAGGVPLLEMSELAKVADEDINSPAGAAAAAMFFNSLLGDEVYAAFRKHCLEHSTDSDTLMQIMEDLVSAKSGEDLPTDAPSPSVDGGAPTGPTYTVISSSGVSVQPLTPELEEQLRAEAGVQPVASGSTYQVFEGELPTG